jgi:hypothetical protein
MFLYVSTIPDPGAIPAVRPTQRLNVDATRVDMSM